MNDPPGGAPPGGGGPNEPPDPSHPEGPAPTVIDQPALRRVSGPPGMPDPNEWEAEDGTSRPGAIPETPIAIPQAPAPVPEMPTREPDAYAPTELFAAQ